MGLGEDTDLRTLSCASDVLLPTDYDVLAAVPCVLQCSYSSGPCGVMGVPTQSAW